MVTSTQIRLIRGRKVIAATDALNPNKRLEIIDTGYVTNLASSPNESGWSGGVTLKVPAALEPTRSGDALYPESGSELAFVTVGEDGREDPAGSLYLEELPISPIEGVVELSLVGLERIASTSVEQQYYHIYSIRKGMRLTVQDACYMLIHKLVGYRRDLAFRHPDEVFAEIGGDPSFYEFRFDPGFTGGAPLAEKGFINYPYGFTVDAGVDIWTKIIELAAPAGLIPTFNRSNMFTLLMPEPKPVARLRTRNIAITDTDIAGQASRIIDSISTQAAYISGESEEPAHHAFGEEFLTSFDADNHASPRFVNSSFTNASGSLMASSDAGVETVTHTVLGPIVADDVALAAQYWAWSIDFPDRVTFTLAKFEVFDPGDLVYIWFQHLRVSALFRVLESTINFGAGGTPTTVTLTAQMVAP